MAFKLTYTDGQEAEYDDDTAWEVDDGVLKMGRTDGKWTVLVSPSHWAVVEVGNGKERAQRDDESKDDSADDSDESDDDRDDDDGDDSDKNKDSDTKKDKDD